ncbi:helix-turn-helix domain-containing protein [Aquirufa sp. ROCK-SH2]
MLSSTMLYAFYQVCYLPIILNSTAFFFTRGFLFTNLCGQVGSLLLFPSILYGLVPKEKKGDKNKSLLSNSNLEIPEELILTSERVLQYIHQEKPYLDPNFSKTDLSIQLKIATKEINDVFDFIIKEKFSSYKNKLRVEHAKELLTNGGANKITMDGIGFNSGFASRSSFYAIFKTETGLTPIEYLEKISE